MMSLLKENTSKQWIVHDAQVNERRRNHRRLRQKSTQCHEKGVIEYPLNVQELEDSNDRVRRPSQQVIANDEENGTKESIVHA